FRPFFNDPDGTSSSSFLLQDMRAAIICNSVLSAQNRLKAFVFLQTEIEIQPAHRPSYNWVACEGSSMPESHTTPGLRREELSLPEAAKYPLDECRMVLPGIQALFGFQLIAVFNSAFHERLSVGERYIHLFATGLVACAIVLIMTPASLHRRSGPHHVYES